MFIFIGPVELLCYAAHYHAEISVVAYDFMSGSGNSRRDFIVRAGAWTIGAAFVRPFSILAATNSSFPGEPVWTKLSFYGNSVQIFGGSVIGFVGGKLPKLTEVRLALDPAVLKKSQAFPLSPVYAAGNLIEYEHPESLIRIKQFLMDSYSAITANPGLSTYRHEALTYDLVNRRVSDPYGCLYQQQLELVQWPSDSESLFAAYLTGWIDSALYHLKPSASFLQLERIALSRSVSLAKEAEQILNDCLENLPLLAMLGTNSTVSRIVSSGTVVSSLAALGSSYEKLLPRATQLMVADPTSAGDGAAWTAVLTSLYERAATGCAELRGICRIDFSASNRCARGSIGQPVSSYSGVDYARTRQS